MQISYRSSQKKCRRWDSNLTLKIITARYFKSPCHISWHRGFSHVWIRLIESDFFYAYPFGLLTFGTLYDIRACAQARARVCTYICGRAGVRASYIIPFFNDYIYLLGKNVIL